MKITCSGFTTIHGYTVTIEDPLNFATLDPEHHTNESRTIKFYLSKEALPAIRFLANALSRVNEPTTTVTKVTADITIEETTLP